MADRKIFREKSLERISSPDRLNEYIKVSSPGVWFAMLAVTVFLIGAVVWAITGRVAVYVPAVANANDGITTLYVPCNELDKSVIDDAIDFETDSGRFVLKGNTASANPIEVTSKLLDEIDPIVVYTGQIRKGDRLYILEGTSKLEDGVSTCKVVSEEHAPIDFIIN